VVFIYHRKHNKNETFFKPGPLTELLHFLRPPPSYFPTNHQLLALPVTDATPTFHSASCQKRTDWKMTYHFCYCSETKYDYDLQRSERLPQLVTTYPEMLVIHNMKKAQYRTAPHSPHLLGPRICDKTCWSVPPWILQDPPNIIHCS
jgi:hypothetical protein